MRASSPGAVTQRRAAAVAYWAVAVLLVTDIALLQGWLEPAAVTTGPRAADRPTEQAATSPAPTTVTLTGGTRVTFPVAPTASTQILMISGAETTLRLHAAEGPDGATYNVGEIEYPPQVDLTDPAQNLLASVSGAAGNVNGRIVDRDVTEYQGAPAVEFVIEADDVRLRARHVLEGRRLLAQNVAFRGTEPEEAEAFFASLELPDLPGLPAPTPTPAP